jgi:hypothetical protein
VWVLDSDVILLRPETVRDALELLERADAAAVGQKTGIPPFLEDGAPATALQIGADEHGLRLAAFPFIEDGYLLHLGRGTLREVAETRDASNRYYDWPSVTGTTTSPGG